MLPTPVFDIAQAFVTAFLGSPDASIRICAMPDAGEKHAHDIEGAITELWPRICTAQERGYGVFYYVNAITEGPGGRAAPRTWTCRAFVQSRSTIP
jgi:hypothetical protein